MRDGTRLILTLDVPIMFDYEQPIRGRQLMIRYIYLLFIIFFYFNLGCNLLDSETDKLDPIEGNILFTVTYDSTELVHSHSGFLLLMKTEKIYSCFNFEIKYSVSSNENDISIRLLGIHLPDNLCATALGPASSRLPLDISNGEYELTFDYEQQTDKYILSIYEVDVVVTKVDTSFTVYKPYSYNS
jgi:hypothetical protein